MVSFVAMDTAKRHGRQPKLPDVQIQEWAARRYGVITRDELSELGLSANAISRRVKAGFLIPIHTALCAPGRNGVGIAARLLDKRLREGADPESRLTRKLLRLIVSSYLPNPISLHGIRLRDGRILHPDLAYPDVKVAIEADGFRDHGRKVVWKNDKARDNALQGLGWIVLRFGWDDVVGRPDYVVATIADALRSRGLVLD